ncbi:hypothetical protein PAXRUDRAFT_28955 [Paxillus rubicundulus Ve08.2h10]|uniref:Uncharacterized protein n=1 Tax=Paxillus rubicundulus Ve08.2h10 TaxID=930991 RepID=A0A0D0CML3_9AGAM|nr:hypothetical protein PAXRUDRAFT_28955 [Paxillus rubicundulus Ve08.2h10]
MIAKKFGVMAEMFFPTDNLFSHASPSPSPPFNTPAHYDSACAEEDTILAKLDSMLPDHLHTLQTSSHFSELFQTSLGLGHSSEIHKLLLDFFHVSSQNCPDLEGCTVGEISLAYEGIVKCAGPKTISANWLVDVASAGCITWAATVTLSFPKVAQQYKHFIILQWESAHIQEILREINQFIFGHAGVKASMRLAMMTQEDLTAEINAAMAAMDIYPISESISEQASLSDSIPETEGLQSRSASISHDHLGTPATTLSGVMNLGGDGEGG